MPPSLVSRRLVGFVLAVSAIGAAVAPAEAKVTQFSAKQVSATKFSFKATIDTVMDKFELKYGGPNNTIITAVEIKTPAPMSCAILEFTTAACSWTGNVAGKPETAQAPAGVVTGSITLNPGLAKKKRKLTFEYFTYFAGSPSTSGSQGSKSTTIKLKPKHR